MMHDPLTVAHTIPNYFKRAHKTTNLDGSTWVYRDPLVTIWHKDPQTDGTDDSCGWSWPKLTKKQQNDLAFLAGCESRDPWFQAFFGKKIDAPTDAETLVRAAFVAVAGQLRVKITLDEATRWAVQMTHNPTDNIRSMLAFLPGYHSNWDEDREEDRKDVALRFFSVIARRILRERRPWWRHPKWHVRHWDVQIHPLMNLKRYAFSRCCKCGKRFRYGEAPVTYSWHGGGPRWFASEPDVFHADCDNPGSTGLKAAEAASA